VDLLSIHLGFVGGFRRTPPCWDGRCAGSRAVRGPSLLTTNSGRNWGSPAYNLKFFADLPQYLTREAVQQSVAHRVTREKTPLSTSEERHAFFDENVPRDVLRTITETLIAVYPAAHRQAYEDYHWRLARDVIPTTRRVGIDSALKFLAERFTGVDVEIGRNAAKNCRHARVHIGRVVLTVSAVANRNELVREAIFRQRYAQDCQLSFAWAEVDELPVDDADADLYALLLHVPHDSQRLPESLVIQFPNHDCSAYLGDPIDLLVRFSGVADSLRRQLAKAISEPELDEIRRHREETSA